MERTQHNICRFLPNRSHADSLNIINFVYETQCPAFPERLTLATYRMVYVTGGAGVLRTDGGVATLQAGDLYLIPPAIPFSLENTEHITFISISYLGLRANAWAEQLQLGRFGGQYAGFDALRPLWESLFELPDEIADMRCEGVLLYTFSEIGKRIFAPCRERRIPSVAERAKRYADEHFTDSGLTVERIAAQLCYHPKYLSATFRRAFNVGLCAYITTLRIQNACTLMAQGITSIKDIAALCGYRDPLYFSSLFKKQMGLSPKAHIRMLNAARE